MVVLPHEMVASQVNAGVIPLHLESHSEQPDHSGSYGHIDYVRDSDTDPDSDEDPDDDLDF